jgi:hypothetical protein
MSFDTEQNLLLLQEFFEVFDRLDIPIQFADLSVGDVKGKGGLCRVNDKWMVILDKELSTIEINEILTKALHNLDTEKIYLPPLVREALEKYNPKC